MPLLQANQSKQKLHCHANVARARRGISQLQLTPTIRQSLFQDPFIHSLPPLGIARGLLTDSFTVE
eukprot:1152788-Pelagomonas_calceolata.AAC.2